MTRAAQGRAAHPVKVAISRRGDLPATAKFFADGDGEKIVLRGDYTDGDALVDALIELAETRGLEDILVEGGASVLMQILATGRAALWRLAVSPHSLGDQGHAFLADPETLIRTYPVHAQETLGDTQVYSFDLTAHRLRTLMERAFSLSERCPPSATAFAVGAIACDASLKILSTGFSRETGPSDHAEEAMLSKLGGTIPHTVICTLEPCLTRASKPTGCAQRLVAAGVQHVVYAVAEDATFTDQTGLHYLRERMVKLTEISGYEDRFRSVNGAIYR